MASEDGVRDGTSGAWQRIAPGIWRRRLPGWDETVGAVVGEDGVLLVDAGPSLTVGDQLRRELAELVGRPAVPVRWLAVTHPHFDHLLGAGAFPGAQRLAADGRTPPWLASDRTVTADAVRHGLDPADAERARRALPAPDRLVDERLVLPLGNGRRATLLNLGAAHSGHDLAVLVTDGEDAPGVVFCGDLVEESGEPQAGSDAEPARWPAALDRLLAAGGPAARYVPGHGAVVDAAFVRAQRAALAARFGGAGVAPGGTPA
ncbi:MBL fold metallo-hydrolase [Streptomyces profundus]|uniref:MBL fold metallo-hydrolase n=1 Tax=Streptomyces profundus TaxID=2867410 RepID=UPI001D15E4B3|nr:MBL fold metallo-hydrolase [Streptomyces sp. MA3_2.13]UED86517.1 MBL fold metallo-hydrolase [Streptomyces sp. MA3_2.13]